MKHVPITTLAQLWRYFWRMDDDILDAERTDPVTITIDWVPGHEPAFRMLPKVTEAAIGELVVALQKENEALRNQLAEQVARRALNEATSK